MAKARRNFNDLSEPYRKRLIRAGITPADYAAGVSVQKARGHGKDALITEFNRLGGPGFVDGYKDLTREQKLWIAEWYIKGFMTPGPADQERRDARDALLGWKLLNGQQANPENWDHFRDNYRSAFGGAR